ncbi:MAG TPA: class I SAM-dependent methyltransferase [Gemmatimonadales bacterium]
MASGASVQHVSDTARWVAFYRAMESERPDAVFRDPYARRLAGPEGEAIVNAMPKGRQFAWPMVVRTAVMDEIILRMVQREHADLVLNLAAGLDARPYRLPLPPNLRWIDADLPAMIDYKSGHLAGERPACRVEFAKVDLTDQATRQSLFEYAGAEARRALVISEGLLVYLTPEQVGALAEDLHRQLTFQWWLFDLGSPRLLRMLERTWGPALRAGNAPLIFAPAEGTAFFEKHGWHEKEFHSVMDESIRLNRTFPLARFWRWVSRFYPKRIRQEFARMSGIVLLERSSEGPRTG